VGAFNSTDTRVAPVFDEILARQPERWLSRIIALASPRHAGFPERELLDWRWGDEEIGLAPPRSLLQTLVSRPKELMKEPEDGLYGTDSPTTRARRASLFAGDAATRDEALRLLSRKRVPTRGWYVFEGETWPDVYIETDSVIVVVEGKRTERTITTKTTWMPVRHQMLRHLDAAHEIADGRKVAGFFIVEGEGADLRAVPSQWMAACAETISPAVLERSLPHRSPEQRQTIRNAYAGVTTWQAVVEEFGLSSDILMAEECPR
jgi:hypothetical protein